MLILLKMEYIEKSSANYCEALQRKNFVPFVPLWEKNPTKAQRAQRELLRDIAGYCWILL
jgi:hypothetical protein